MTYIVNPKTKGSGVVCAIPQTGTCPNNCADCFFQSGRSYLEPLDENLPNLPEPEDCVNRVVRMNDGNDSNVEKGDVVEAAGGYEHFFFNTAVPDLDFPGPVVLTVNPGEMTDVGFHKIKKPPVNLMFVRIRTNAWNVEDVVVPAVDWYTSRGVPVVLTYMAYYGEDVPEDFRHCYEFKKRTLNSYWVLDQLVQDDIEADFWRNDLVYTCGWKGTHPCSRCGNCLREYFNAVVRMEGRGF